LTRGLSGDNSGAKQEALLSERRDNTFERGETMLKLHKDLPKAKTPHEAEALQRQIATTDRQIDTLVYELYGLTKEEITIVEAAQT